MASWLKAAEDLFEVVDRRAKLVVSELSDEQPGSQPSASNGHEVQPRRGKLKKGQIRLADSETAKNIIPEQEKNDIQSSVPNTKTDGTEKSLRRDSLEAGTTLDKSEASTELPSDTNKDTFNLDTACSTVIQTDKDAPDSDSLVEITVTGNQVELLPSFTDDNVTVSNTNDALDTHFSPSSLAKETDTSKEDHHANANTEVSSVDEPSSLPIDQVRPEPDRMEGHSYITAQEADSIHLREPSPKIKKRLGNNTDTSHMKIEDQLDEAQGLLKNTNSTGQSKEARLAKVCAGLSSRLQEYKSENAQLEELLVAERELSSSYEARMKQLQQEFSLSKAEVARVESEMADALAAKNSEIEALVGSTDALKKQVAASEGKLAALQANMEEIMRSRELTETRMMQALREELASAERRAEEERAAHNATKMAAVEREVELEHRAVEASNALARMQRAADESTSRAAELEHKVALLEVECASLTQELQDMEARNRRGQKKPSEEANQILQMQAWQEEVERARQGQRDAETKISSMEAELQKMRVELAGMKRDAEHYSRQEHMELEKRYRELTDLLYHKQTQVEAIASEKAAVEFQLEKERKRFQEIQVEAERSRTSRRASSLWEEDTDIKALEPLPLHHRHMAAANIQLQRAAKLLDSGAVRATRFLWRYPIARVILLFYLVFVHLFLMYLLHHLQEQADSFASREVAASMGLSNSSLP